MLPGLVQRIRSITTTYVSQTFKLYDKETPLYGTRVRNDDRLDGNAGIRSNRYDDTFRYIISYGYYSDRMRRHCRKYARASA